MSDPTHIKDLIPDPKNARLHNPRNIGMIADAMQEVGAARSVVIDENNIILAGNGAIEAAAQAGITDVRIIEASGNEIIAVRRSGLTAAQKARLALFDNRAAELAEWDADVVRELHDDGLLAGMFTDEEYGGVIGDDVALTASETVGESATKGLKQLQFTMTPEQATIIEDALDAAIKAGLGADGPSPHKEGNALVALISQVS